MYNVHLRVEDSRTPYKKSICGTDLESRSIESQQLSRVVGQ